MATVIHEDGGPDVVRHEHIREVERGDGGLGGVLAVIIALVVIALLLFYGLPLFRNAAANRTINVNLNPSGSNGGAQQNPAGY